MTASVIYSWRAPGVPVEALAITTAKLCRPGPALGRPSRFPVPLHAARQMDPGHPQFRRAATAEEKPTAGSRRGSIL